MATITSPSAAVTTATVTAAELPVSTPLEERAEAEIQSRFGIGEWYGRSFTELTAEQRNEFADYRLPSNLSLKANERLRLIKLRAKASTTALNAPEASRLTFLEEKFINEQRETKLCPFKELSGYGRLPCTKPGGVCSLRAYEQSATGAVTPTTSVRGALRTLCPSRFHEAGTAFKWASREILGQPAPSLVGEVGFLESSETYDGAEGEDVGRIDMVVVDNSKPAGFPLPWIALEIQAVYFSGPEMGKLFTQIKEDIAAGGSGLVYPKETRRPDYRSSGPKRLMPQLQIKVPTLRRWGKRMAIVVDRPFYESMGIMQTANHVSLSDVAWFVVDFVLEPVVGRFRLVEGSAYFMTLEEAVKGLTGGTPVAQPDFESRITSALSPAIILSTVAPAAGVTERLPGV
jgi:Restriction endonuclease NotI